MVDAIEVFEGDAEGPVRLPVEIADGDDAARSVLPVDVVQVDLFGGILEVFLFEVEYHLIGFRHHEAVEPDHRSGEGEGHEQIGRQDAIERDAPCLKRRQLELLGELPGEVDTSEEDCQRRGQTNDFRDVVQVIHEEDVLHGRTPVHEVVDGLDIMKHDKEDDQRSDQKDIALNEPAYDMSVKRGHGEPGGT